MVGENSKSFRRDNVLVHELICATNIYKISYNAINKKEKPIYLSRSKNTSTGLDEIIKPKFTCFEIWKYF